MAHYEAIVIGVSAGGMHALSIVLASFSVDFSVSVIIVQHRMRDSDSFLKVHLDELCKLKVVEAEANEKIMPGKVYLAPGGYHLMIESEKIFSLSVDHQLVSRFHPSMYCLRARPMFIKKN